MIEETLLEAIDKMDKAVEPRAVAVPDRAHRARRAGARRELNVEYYGAPVPLQQLAGIQVPEARQLLVRPHDRGSLGAIEKAIRDSDLGVNPSNDGIVDPPVVPAAHRGAAQGVRQGRQAHGRGRPGRRAQRAPRRPQAPRGAPRRRGEISADELERAEKELEKITHEHVEAIDAALGRKEAELLEV